MRDSRGALPPRARSIQLRHAYQGELLSHRRATRRRIFAVANDGDSGVCLTNSRDALSLSFLFFFLRHARSQIIDTMPSVERITIHGEIGRSPPRNSLYSVRLASAVRVTREETHANSTASWPRAALLWKFLSFAPPESSSRFFRNEISPTRSTATLIFF